MAQLAAAGIRKNGVNLMEKADIQQYLANILFLFAKQEGARTHEEQVLKEVCQRLGATDVDLEEAKALCGRETFSIRPVGATMDRLRNLEDLLDVAFADGTLVHIEKQAIPQFAKDIGLTKKQWDPMVAEAKRKLQDRNLREKPRIGINYAHLIIELSVNRKTALRSDSRAYL